MAPRIGRQRSGRADVRAIPKLAQVRRVLCALRIEVEGVHDEDECDLRRNKRVRQMAIRLRPQDLLDSPREGIEWLEDCPQPCQGKSPASPLPGPTSENQ